MVCRTLAACRDSTSQERGIAPTEMWPPAGPTVPSLSSGGGNHHGCGWRRCAQEISHVRRGRRGLDPPARSARPGRQHALRPACPDPALRRGAPRPPAGPHRRRHRPHPRGRGQRHAPGGHAAVPGHPNPDGAVERPARRARLHRQLPRRHRAGHLGLAAIEERARLAGGVLSIRSNPGAGSVVELVLPAATPAAGSGQPGGDPSRSSAADNAPSSAKRSSTTT